MREKDINGAKMIYFETNLKGNIIKYLHIYKGIVQQIMK